MRDVCILMTLAQLSYIQSEQTTHHRRAKNNVTPLNHKMKSHEIKY